MRKAERLFQIMTILRSRRTVITALQLAGEFGVSERTIYRDMQSLSLSGVPIESEAGIGYRLNPKFSVPPLMFSAEEMEALILGVRMVQGWSDDQLHTAADSALAKIQAVLPEELHYRYVQQPEWLVVPDFHREQSSQFGDQIRHAIKQRHILHVRYQREDGEQSTRDIRPLGLLFWGRSWTLVGWCELRQDYRLFRLDRIQQLEMTSQIFPRSEDITLQNYLAQYRD